MADTIRVLIADDHRLTLDGVVRAIEPAEDITVVGQAFSGAEVMPLVRETEPDVVLTDLRMPKVDGLTCLDLILKRRPDTKVIIFSASSEPEQIQRALGRGAAGYILKSVNPLDLPAAIRQVADQTVYYAPPRSNATAASTEDPGLTDKERAVLAALTRGLSNKAIARELWVTEQTVKFHLSNVYRKLGVSSRTAAARYAHEHQLGEGADQGLQPSAA